MDLPFHPQAKPEPRQQIKRRKIRKERVVATRVRAQCVDRDGFCRLAAAYWGDDIPRALWPHSCVGPSEWAHLHRRSQTRGQAPERRHTTTHSLMLCRWLHQMEEAGQLRVIALTARGCDGPVRFQKVAS